MPIYNTACKDCLAKIEKFVHHERDRVNAVFYCSCGGELEFLPTFGTPLTYFEEGRGRWIHNMADEPVYVTSHAEHKALMKKHGVAEAPPKRGMPGSWA